MTRTALKAERPGSSVRPVAAALVLVVLAAAFGWAYWPTILELLRQWDSSPDYSHGYLVVPVALYFLWARRDRFPGLRPVDGWAALAGLGVGLLLVAASIAVRWLGARYRFEAVDGWSMLFWLAGVAWVLGGWRLFRWCLPSVAFLLFMIPLPYRIDRSLTVPLQGVATEISTWTLQLLGQPAFAQGNVITLGEHRLEVAEACSGLRILVGVTAIAFAYCVLIRNSWLKRIVIALAVVPVALIANATRIVVTGLLYQIVSAEAGQKFSHDVVGWLMIPYAAALFALVVWYVERLFPQVEEFDMVGVYYRRGSSSRRQTAPLPRQAEGAASAGSPAEAGRG